MSRLHASLRQRRRARPAAESIDTELGHDLRAMPLDRAFRDAQIVAICFVQLAADNAIENLTLTLCQRIEARAQLTCFVPRSALDSASRASARPSASSRMSRCTGFVRKSTAPAFIPRTVEGTSACPVRKTTGKLDASSLQTLLKRESGGPGQAQIEQQAPRAIGHRDAGGTRPPSRSRPHQIRRHPAARSRAVRMDSSSSTTWISGVVFMPDSVTARRSRRPRAIRPETPRHRPARSQPRRVHRGLRRWSA